jgi:hypothetical protein
MKNINHAFGFADRFGIDAVVVLTKKLTIEWFT